MTKRFQIIIEGEVEEEPGDSQNSLIQVVSESVPLNDPRAGVTFNSKVVRLIRTRKRSASSQEVTGA